MTSDPKSPTPQTENLEPTKQTGSKPSEEKSEQADNNEERGIPPVDRELEDMSLASIKFAPESAALSKTDPKANADPPSSKAGDGSAAKRDPKKGSEKGGVRRPVSALADGPKKKDRSRPWREGSKRKANNAPAEEKGRKKIKKSSMALKEKGWNSYGGLKNKKKKASPTAVPSPKKRRAAKKKYAHLKSRLHEPTKAMEMRMAANKGAAAKPKESVGGPPAKKALPKQVSGKKRSLPPEKRTSPVAEKPVKQRKFLRKGHGLARMKSKSPAIRKPKIAPETKAATTKHTNFLKRGKGKTGMDRPWRQKKRKAVNVKSPNKEVEEGSKKDSVPAPKAKTSVADKPSTAPKTDTAAEQSAKEATA